MKKKLFIAGMSFVIALILLATASFAWFTFSASPEVSGMQLAIYTDSTLLLASDVNGEPGEFTQYISLSDNFTGLAPLRPVSTADGINWFLPAYDTETGFLAPVSEFILDNTLEHGNVKVTDEDGNGLTGDVYEGQQRKGYYVYTDLWMKTEDAYANVRLSVPHLYGTAEERRSGDAEASGLSSTELNQAVYGTYVLGEPELDLTDASDPQLADRVTQPETAIRVGFLVYQDKKTLETGSDGKTLPFAIYEPNADKRAGAPGMTSEYVVPDENGDVTNTKQSYISGYTPETEVVAEGNYVITQPIALGTDGKAVLGSIAPENLIVQNASEWDETETVKTLSGQRANGNTHPNSNDIAEFGQFLKTDERFVLSDENGQRTALRIGNGGDVQTDIAGSHVIVTLKKDTPVRVRIFIWIEGQDVDCWNNIAAGTFRVNLELAGESLVKQPPVQKVVRGTLKGYGRSDDPSSGWFDSTAAGIQRTAITALEFTDEVPEGYSATWNAGTDSGDDAINAYLVGTKVYIVVPKGADAVCLPASSNRLFYNMKSCTAISGLDMTDTSNVTDMGWMFLGDEKLARVDVSGFDTSNVTGMYQMFKDCKALTVLDVSGFHTEKVRNMEGLFQNCEKLTSLDVSGFDTSSVTTMYDMFYYCKGLTSLDVSGFNTSKVTTMAGMFYGCSGLTSLDVTGFDTSNVTSMSMLFQSCGKLTSIDLSGFDTSKVRCMDYMFSGCSGLTSLDVSPLDTSQVYGMKKMFSSLNLSSLDLSSMDTSAATCMTGMFQNCDNLTSLDLSNFNTSKVWGMDWMFYGCESLETLDLSGFDTSKVTTMEYMFEYCESLTSLDVSGFDTSKVTDMSYMFASCRSLTSLDVSGFDTALVEDFRGTFMRCTNLTTIYAGSGWSLASRKVGVGAYWTTFEDSTRLVGGNGTAFSTAHDDYDYARIDTAETPGYFTAKSN